MRGILTAGRVRSSLLARAGVAVVAATGLALAGAAIASGASAGAAPAVLRALDCRSLTQCVAVGVNTPDKPSQLTADNWNGKAWVRVAVPKPPGSVTVNLNGVACPASHQCVAVGRAYPKSGGFYAIGAVWNGTRWSAAKAAVPGSSSDLFAVSCPATNSCFAAGRYTPKGSSRWTVLIEHWNGKTWARSYPVVASDGSYPILRSVSCSSAGACLAVGDNVSEAFVEQLAGGQFVPVRDPFNGGTPRYLGQVSCVSATRCVALASAWPNSQSWRSEAEFWNGTSWQTVLTT